MANQEVSGVGPAAAAIPRAPVLTGPAPSAPVGTSARAVQGRAVTGGCPAGHLQGTDPACRPAQVCLSFHACMLNILLLFICCLLQYT